MKLLVVICSTRPERAGVPVATWFFDRAKAQGAFEAELVDLKEVGLPLLDEPEHPRFGRYQHEHTKAWSAKVKSADAFVFVTPEYNYGPPASLVNALDYLAAEWAYKPCAFVSYGGVSGGTRSVQMSKQIVTTLRMMPLPEAVVVPFVGKQLDENGAFKGGEPHEGAAKALLAELARWATALAPLRAPRAG